VSRWARHIDDLAAATVELLVNGPEPARPLADPTAALIARDDVLAELRALVGAVSDVAKVEMVRELTIFDLVHRPGQALHQALSELPRAATFGAVRLVPVVDKTLAGYEQAWQRAAQATIGLEGFVDALGRLPEQHAWIALRDLADFAAALPYLDYSPGRGARGRQPPRRECRRDSGRHPDRSAEAPRPAAGRPRRQRARRGAPRQRFQLAVHLATDKLPPYPNARPGDWNGLQSHVDTLEELRRGFLSAEARRLPDPPATYCFTPSVYDDSLAPAGKHTVYLACPSAPFDVEGGWADQAEGFADAMVEQHAPGFTNSILARTVRTPTLMADELRWPGAHPMHLDISLDQLAFMRPTRRLSGHTVPGVAGLFTCGASTAPVGGIAGSSGKAAALALLKAKA